MSIPIPKVSRVERCASCGSEDREYFDRGKRRPFLVVGDGPPVCRVCLRDAGRVGSATVRRSDTPRRPR